MLKHRIFTAAVLIPVVIAVIFLLDTSWFALLLGVFVVIGAWEWALLSKLDEKQAYLYCFFILLSLVVLYWLNNNGLYYAVIAAGVFYWLVAIFLVLSYQKQRNHLPKSQIPLLFIGLLLLIPMWSSLIILKSFSAYGASLLFFLMLLIWSADTAAYFAGKKWGKRKLANHVSPGKTWEGTVAGIFASILVTLCYVIVSNTELEHEGMFIGLSIITVTISVFGDLMESLVKREANSKDSGSILPGHGGVMDRIDSLTAAGPVFVFGLICLGIIV